MGTLEGEFTVPPYFDYFATFTWALSGAIVGAGRGFDITGVFVIALVSSTGGGLLRDGLLLQRTPAFLTNGSYLVLVATATLVVAMAARRFIVIPRWTFDRKLVELIDAVGVPAYAIVGMQLAQAHELSIPGVVLVGVVNGVGGGLLRDVLANEPAHLLLPGQYSALVLLFACLAFVGLTRWYGIAATAAGLTTVATVLSWSAP
jgi:uncharacterized membrane protein YeiH